MTAKARQRRGTAPAARGPASAPPVGPSPAAVREPLTRPARHRAQPREIAPGVYWLQAGTGLLGSNVYFIRSGPSWVLVDAAWPGREKLIRAGAGELFGAGTRPAAILLTHIHPDHSGSARALARAWDAGVYVHPAELPMAAGEYLPAYANPLDRWLVGPLVSILPARARRRMAAAGSLQDVASALAEGAGVPGLPDWEWVPTPGHTPGHIALYRAAGQVLITGDAVLTVNLNSLPDLLRWRQVAAGPPRFTSWDWAAAVRSVARLAQLEPQVLAPGHGRPMTGPAAAAALHACARRLAGRPAG